MKNLCVHVARASTKWFLGCTKPVTNFIPKPNVKHSAYQKGDLEPRSASLDQRYIGNSERHVALVAAGYRAVVHFVHVFCRLYLLLLSKIDYSRLRTASAIVYSAKTYYGRPMQ